jgi:hypothetical protein
MARGARFYWVLAPATAFPGRVTAMPKLNEISRKVAGRRAGLVDAWNGFGGKYNAALHEPDGLHLSQAGQDRLARLVVAAIG